MTISKHGKNKSGKRAIIIAIIVVLLLLVAAVAYVPVSSYIAGRFASVDETVIAADEEVPAAVAEITDEELDKLISGEVSLDDILAGGTAGSGEQGSASSVQENEVIGYEAAVSTGAGSEAGASSGEATSASDNKQAAETQTEASSSAGSKADSGGTGASSSGVSGGSGSETSAYEAEIKALIVQLYAVKSRAESGLNACVESARAEYKALPEAQQTQAKKIAICFSKAGQLSALQASCDKEVESIVSQMRQVLTENGQSTSLADQALESYNSQKSARYNELMAKLYS